MTRAEFFSQRAIADFTKQHGVTVCPPNAVALAELRFSYRRGTRAARDHARVRNNAQRMSEHARDRETGAAVAPQSGRNRRR